MSKREVSSKESALEILRIDYTDLNQDQFAVKCDIPRATYHRWISSGKQPRLTPSQIVKVCNICKISFNDFFTALGEDISEIPKK